MRILLTNDDGIHAKGLLSLYNFAKNDLGFDDIWIVAPDSDKSAASHSLSISRTIISKKLGEKCFSISGTPVDCVIVAVEKLMKNHPPDLIFSGINSGANLGKDVIYSGTVGAAMEGTFLGIYSFAFSRLYLNSKESIEWETNNTILTQLMKDLIMKQQLFKENTININLPITTEPSGIKYIEQGSYKTTNCVLHKNSELSPEESFFSIHNESIDEEIAKNNAITVTLLGHDLTSHNNVKLNVSSF